MNIQTVNACPHCGSDELSQGDEGMSFCWNCELQGHKVEVQRDLNVEFQPSITKQWEVV